MKYWVFLVLAYFFFSCDNEIEKDTGSFPDLLLSSYSLEGAAYDFCCIDSNLFLVELDQNVYYSHDDVMFASFINGQPKRVKEGKLYDDLLLFLSKLSPNYVGYTHSFVDNPISSIMIYSDSTFCGVPKGKSLNHLFLLEGEFIRKVGNKYEFYNGADILEKAGRIEDILFPEEFRLKFINGLTIEKNNYRFYLRLKYGNHVVDVKIAEIHLV